MIARLSMLREAAQVACKGSTGREGVHFLSFYSEMGEGVEGNFLFPMFLSPILKH